MKGNVKICIPDANVYNKMDFVKQKEINNYL